MMMHSKSDFIQFGHRGVKSLAPENTLLGFQKALDLGFRAVELDVFEKDNRLLVIHQADLSHTTNGSGRLESVSMETIQTLDAGHGERIPFLEDVLACIRGQCIVNIELKSPGTADRVYHAINHAIHTQGFDRNQFIVSSFDLVELMAFRQYDTDTAVGILYVGVPLFLDQLATSLDATSLHLSDDFVCQGTIDQAHQLGLSVYVFTVNTVDRLLQLQSMGCQGVFTDCLLDSSSTNS